MGRCASCSGTDTCSGGPGSNVYTRSLAREWSRAGHDVVVFAQEPHPEQYDLGGAGRPPGHRTGCCRPSSSTSTRASRRGCAGPDRGRARALRRRRTPKRSASTCRPTSCSRTTSCSAGPSRPRRGARYAVKAHGSELEYSMRGNEELSALGEGDARGRRGGVRRLRAHPQGARGGRRPRRPGPRRPAGRRRRRVRPRCRATRRCAACSPRAAPIRRTRATRTSGCPTRGTPSASRRSSPTTSRRSSTSASSCDNKGVHVLLEALRDVDARAVVVGFGDYRAELEALAPPRTLFTGPLEHRHLAKLIPLTDVTVVPSIFPEAFGMVAAEAAAAGSLPSSRTTRAWPRSPRASPPSIRSADRDLTSFATRRLGRPRREAAAAVRARPRASEPSSPKPPGARSSSAGAGRASRRRPPGAFSLTSRRGSRRSVLSGDEQLRLGREQYESATDFTVAVEEEFAILDPETLVAHRRLRAAESRGRGDGARAAPRR